MVVNIFYKSGEQGHCPHHISKYLVTVMRRPGTEGRFQTHPPTHTYTHPCKWGLSHPADTQSDKFRIKSFPVFQFLVTEVILAIKLWRSKANSKGWNLFWNSLCSLISHDERRVGQLMKRKPQGPCFCPQASEKQRARAIYSLARIGFFRSPNSQKYWVLY